MWKTRPGPEKMLRFVYVCLAKEIKFTMSQQLALVFYLVANNIQQQTIYKIYNTRLTRSIKAKLNKLFKQLSIERIRVRNAGMCRIVRRITITLKESKLIMLKINYRRTN